MNNLFTNYKSALIISLLVFSIFFSYEINNASALSESTNKSGNGSSSKLTLSKTKYAVNEKIVVNYSNFSGSSEDWIGIYSKGASNSNYKNWKYTDGSISGKLNFSNLPAGNYEARGFFNDNYTVVCSTSFTVGSNSNIKPTNSLSKPTSNTKSLNVSATVQEKSNWCWAASCSGIINFLKPVTKLPSQSDIVTFIKGSAANEEGSYSEMKKVFTKYNLKSSESSYVSFESVMGYINKGKPFSPSIYWSDGGSHSVILYGYSNGNNQTVSYMDPWGSSNRFNTLTYSKFKSNSEYEWRDSIYIE